MSDAEIGAVLTFWFETSGPDDWFAKNEAFDAEIKKRFMGLHQDIMEDTREHFRHTARGCLAEIIVLDQFSRNMFRDTADAFASDPRALDCLNHILHKGYDRNMSQQERNFAYLPLEHSENLEDQKKAVALFEENGDAVSLDYAIQHMKIIERFGRFPHRNKILGRLSTDEELEFLTKPGSSF